MKRPSAILFFVLLSMSILLCECDSSIVKNKVPIITIDSIYNISNISAEVKFNIRQQDANFYGVCYSQTEMPDINDPVSNEFNTSGTPHNMVLQYLQEETTYYVRAYAIHNDFVYYSHQDSFTTLKQPQSPCSPPQNSFINDEDTTYFKHVEITDNPLMKSYKVDAFTEDYNSHLTFVFAKNPESGIYSIVASHDFIDFMQLQSNIKLNTRTFYPDYEEKVYVVNTDSLISLHFCKAHFVEGDAYRPDKWYAYAYIVKIK
jgi:hypothetical protein